MNKKVSRAGKDFLVNTIKNVEYQNKVREERLMWGAQKSSSRERSPHRERCRLKRPSSSRRSPSGSCRRNATNGNNGGLNIDYNGCSNYYLKKLDEAESKDSNRWGHSGFKELYPEEFKSSSSSNTESAESNSTRQTSKKRKREDSSSTESSSSSSISSENTSEEERRRKSHKKKSHRISSSKHKSKKSKKKSSSSRSKHKKVESKNK